MEISTLVSVLDQPHLAADHLHDWGLADVRRGQQILLELAETGLTLDLLASICRQLGELRNIEIHEKQRFTADRRPRRLEPLAAGER